MTPPTARITYVFRETPAPCSLEAVRFDTVAERSTTSESQAIIQDTVDLRIAIGIGVDLAVDAKNGKHTRLFCPMAAIRAALHDARLSVESYQTIAYASYQAAPTAPDEITRDELIDRLLDALHRDPKTPPIGREINDADGVSWMMI